MLHFLIETLHCILDPIEMKVTLFLIFHIKLEVSQTLFRSTCESITLAFRPLRLKELVELHEVVLIVGAGRIES